MKKILCLMLTMLLLCGCGAREEIPEGPEAALSGSAFGQSQSWDREGILEEIPLTVSGGWQLGSSMSCRDGILLWTIDGHLEGETKIELCLINGADGEIIARNTLSSSARVTPQVLGERIFLCDSKSGTVTELGEDLTELQSWSFDPGEDFWYMGSDCLYRTEEGKLLSLHAQLKAKTEVLEEGKTLNYLTLMGDILCIDCMDDATGESRFALLDLNTGELQETPFEGWFSTAQRVGDYWLCNYAQDGSIWFLGTKDEPLRVRLEESSLRLLDRGHLLQTNFEDNDLTLYDLQGKFLSACRLSEMGNCYLVGDPMWCESRGGYYLHIQSFDSGSRLLFWDISKGSEGENLPLESVPERTEAMETLCRRADAIGEEYGLSILLADQCSREFDAFTAELAEDPVMLDSALTDLEQALQAFPQGFFRQLRHGDMQSIQIQLIQDLQATDERAGGSYAAFTQNMWKYYLMVVDIRTSSPDTYFHEFSHIIDTCLLDQGVMTEEDWAALNPEGFEYAYTYANQWELEGDPEHFVDTYAMISPTEDRARILEYAMMEGSGWMFEDYPGLKAKLRFYSDCIRNYFDIPQGETLLWEQYL